MKFTVIKELEINTEVIKSLSEEKFEENEEFRGFLKTLDSDSLDKTVFDLNQNISAQIDCTKCGACCNQLMINVEDSDVPRIAGHLNIEENTFLDKYVECGSTMKIMNSIPCSFLKNKMCTVYEGRFTECREFPNLHKPAFNKRLFATLIHYGMCPIIFNVIEHLKIVTGFKKIV